jgi:drug/metabolite transporter (DMT)-like permease
MIAGSANGVAWGLRRMSEISEAFPRVALLPAALSVGKATSLTAIALIAFVANSLVCRAAIVADDIDPASFATVRLAAGALTLWVFAANRRSAPRTSNGDWIGGACLAVFVVAFAFAYRFLTVSTGALILFGAVQITMLLAARRAGERFAPLAWVGFSLAIAGLIYLLSPGLTAPPPAGAVLMVVAGVAWGFYSLRGRVARDPLWASAGNFVRALPLAASVSLFCVWDTHLSLRGVGLACASGAVASGVGFAVWYAALRHLTASRAATVQLTVPVIAAVAGVLLLAEPLTWRLPLAAMAILGGIALVLSHRAPATPALMTR